MNEIVEQSSEYFHAGRKSEKNGLYFLATLRYGQAHALAVVAARLHASGSLELSDEEQGLIVQVSEEVSIRLEIMIGKIGNGHRKLSGPIQSSDSVRSAMETLLSEVQGSM